MADDHCDLLCLDLPRAEAVRKSRLDPDRAARLAGRASGLSDPTRLMLAAALLEAGELCVCDMAWISERASNLVSHHLRALRSQELVRSRRQGKLAIYELTEGGRELVQALLRLTTEPGASVPTDAAVAPT